MTTLDSIFNDDFSKDFFRRGRIEFPSLTDPTTFFEDSKLNFDKIISNLKRDREARHERLGIEFPSKAFDVDFPLSNKSFPSLLGSNNSNTFNSSRTIESSNRLLNGTLANLNNNSHLNSNALSINDTGSIADGKYTVNIPLGNRIQPEDLKISLKEEGGLKIMTIEAKREEKSEDGNSKSMISQQISRKFTLPPNVDIKTVQSILTEGGNLKIEAPLQATPPPRPAIQHQPQNQVEVKRYAPTTIPISIQ